MGLFDFFKGQKNEETHNDPVTNEKSDQITIQYETKLTARELKADKTQITEIVDKMVEEDPFKHYYKGKTLEDMTPLAQRLYKYEAITTVNVDFHTKEKDRILVVVEGKPVGFIPEDKARTIQENQSRFLLTAFVYVTGGPYIEYDKEQDKPVAGESPLGLDIFIQFT
ncbi:hypothetical protein [Alkalibacterium olivapovliticus]|uniref:Uncharacterized protein n=1 Tax=Alkalibacterium olivapovliticus TaxID=99907 RepID=A0A2T0WA96_9LACT|nr:hypothetical protein [Alkalibacterium olivapovliticus]PRY83635.1 hypothetical protein CLV38_10358 [Alkalibacterium olivapovliticus]